MRINYNVSAMISNNALSNSDDLLAKSLERLSSGLKINNAKDNPAGLAMAKRMNAQLEGLSKASQNASDGISIIETADGALSEIQEMVQNAVSNGRALNTEYQVCNVHEYSVTPTTFNQGTQETVETPSEDTNSGFPWD